jgi:anionic cell wall polymer biosynthesis LytR-Cps2A-Psr (LCP) family protein
VSYIFFVKTKVLTVTPNSTVSANFEEAEPIIPEKPINILLLGHGGPGHSGGDLMDSIILLSIDTQNKKALTVSIPRDTWIESRKINEGYVAGGYSLLLHQVEVVTGIFPENYVSIDFERYQNMIDALGGLDVNVPASYEDPFYPIRGEENNTCGFSAEKFAELHQLYSGYQLETQFTCRYEHLNYSIGVNHMDGATALKYVRSRHGDSDFGRSKRQFIILSAIVDKMLSFKGIRSLTDVIDELSKMVQTNLDINELKGVVSFLASDSDYAITQLNLTDENVLENGKSATGQYVLLPKDGSFSTTINYIQQNY